MPRAVLAALALIAASPAFAQPPAILPAADTSGAAAQASAALQQAQAAVSIASGKASAADVANQISVATSGLAKAADVVAAVAPLVRAADLPGLVVANIPFSSTVPPMETPAGAAGSTKTVRDGGAVQPRITRMVLNQTTGAGGTKAVTWAPALPAIPGVLPIPHVSTTTTSAPLCFPVEGTTTVSGSTIKCFTTQTVTVSVLGLTVAPITAAAAGIVFDVFAVPAS